MTRASLFSRGLGVYWETGVTPTYVAARSGYFHSGFNWISGGRGWDRTSDPYDVNVVLFR